MSVGPLNPNRVQLQGGIAADESDQTGSGNSEVTFSTAVRFVDVWNGGTGDLTITSGGVSRIVPPESGRLVNFPETSTTFSITADAGWVVTPAS